MGPANYDAPVIDLSTLRAEDDPDSLFDNSRELSALERFKMLPPEEQEALRRQHVYEQNLYYEIRRVRRRRNAGARVKHGRQMAIPSSKRKKGKKKKGY